MMKKVILLIAAVFGSALMQGKVRLPAILSDNMVLQQQTEAPVWGKAAPGKKVSVKASWGASASAVAGSDSLWSVRLKTPSAGGPYTLKISDGQPVTLSDVLIGEVWFCSGQSNMEMPVKGFNRQPVEGSLDVILAADPSAPIRLVNVEKGTSLEPQWDCKVDGWNLNESRPVADASATAYFFGKALYEKLHIPIGLIMTDWGGTAIEPWMSLETLQGAGYDISQIEAVYPKWKQNTPTALYNAMVAPLSPYAVRGFIWYQGESNRPGRVYSELQTAFGKMLRKCFGDGSDAQPYYFVQIAPYNYGDPSGTGSGYMYEQQAKTLAMLPNSGMAVTNDIGNLNCIHPANKQEVGRRLALLALKNDYGVLGNLAVESPLYEKVEFNGFRATVTFNVGSGSLAPLGEEIEGFEVAGANKVFHPASARISGANTVDVWSGTVSDIKAVRYCFRNYQVGNLTNIFGIPASPFRTDEW